MYGKYRAETEKHWMQYDKITEQIHRHEDYLERLSSLGLNKKTEKRYRRLVSQNLRVIKGLEAQEATRLADRTEVERSLFPYGGLSDEA